MAEAARKTDRAGARRSAGNAAAAPLRRSRPTTPRRTRTDRCAEAAPAAPPRSHALDAVRAAADRAGRRRLFVRDRRPGDVDRRCLCQADKVGVSTDVSGIVQDVDGEGQPARRRRPGSLPARSAPVPDRARQRQGQSGADGVVDRSDEAGLQAHGERRRRAAGAGRSRPAQLRPQRHAAAHRHDFAGRLRSGALHARQRQEQTRGVARAGAGAARQTRRQSRRRGDRASAISAGASAGRRGAASTRSHGDHGAVCRHRHQRAGDRAGKISRGFDHGLLSRRHRPRLGRCQAEGDRADLRAAGPDGRR